MGEKLSHEETHPQSESITTITCVRVHNRSYMNVYLNFIQIVNKCLLCDRHRTENWGCCSWDAGQTCFLPSWTIHSSRETWWKGKFRDLTFYLGPRRKRTSIPKPYMFSVWQAISTDELIYNLLPFEEKRVLQYRFKEKKFNTKQHIRNIKSVTVYGDNTRHVPPSKAQSLVASPFNHNGQGGGKYSWGS